jgi:2,3-dihydroxybiphenyl 1,2-dioxygenase
MALACRHIIRTSFYLTEPDSLGRIGAASGSEGKRGVPGTMVNTGVTELGYLGIGIRDIDAWRFYANEILGMEWVEEHGEPRLRMDYWHHRILIHPGEEDDVLFAGLRVAGPEEFRVLQRHLGECGVPFKVGSPADAEKRSVLELLRLTDPAGLALEIFHGPRVDRHEPYRPGRGMHGKFVTGLGGLGHMIIRDAGVEESYRFYSKVLGMRGSIEVRYEVGGKRFEPIFMHSCERDHTLGFGAGPLPKRIHHLMVEVDTIDDVGLAYDLARRHDVPILIAPGRHANDNMFSFYMQTPSGWFCEYGFGGTPPVHQSEYNVVGDIFGHELVAKSYTG